MRGRGEGGLGEPFSVVTFWGASVGNISQSQTLNWKGGSHHEKSSLHQ